MSKKALSLLSTAVVVVLGVAVFGQLIYMNVRSADPVLPGWEEFDAAKFEQRAARDERQLVEIYASWCPTCLAQHKALEAMVADGKIPQIRAIRVDYDRDENFRKQLGVTATGLLLIMKGDQIEAVAGGRVTREAITEFLQKADVGFAATPPSVSPGR